MSSISVMSRASKEGISKTEKEMRQLIQDVMRFLYKGKADVIGEFKEKSKSRVNPINSSGTPVYYSELEKFVELRLSECAVIVSITKNKFRAYHRSDLVLSSTDLNSCDFCLLLGNCLAKDSSNVYIECDNLNRRGKNRLLAILKDMKLYFDNRVCIILISVTRMPSELQELSEIELCLSEPVKKKLKAGDIVNVEECAVKLGLLDNPKVDSSEKSHGTESEGNQEHKLEIGSTLVEFKIKMEESNQIIKSLNEDHERLQKDHENLQKDHKSLQKDEKSLQKDHDSLIMDRESLQKVHNSLQKDQESLQEDYDRLLKDYKSLEKDQGSFNNAHQSLQRDHLSLEKDQEDLKKDQESLQKDHVSLQEDHVSLKEDHASLKKENASLQNVYQQLLKEHQSSIVEIESFKVERTRLKGERDTSPPVILSENSESDVVHVKTFKSEGTELRNLKDIIKVNQRNLKTATAPTIVKQSIPKLHYKTNITKKEDGMISYSVIILKGDIIQDYDELLEFDGQGVNIRLAKINAFEKFINNVEKYDN
jgi:peptidoglycan hydrolase CwlO-like protein